MNEQDTEFTDVDISEFFDKTELPSQEESIDTGIVVFTENQKELEEDRHRMHCILLRRVCLRAQARDHRTDQRRAAAGSAEVA